MSGVERDPKLMISPQKQGNDKNRTRLLRIIQKRVKKLGNDNIDFFQAKNSQKENFQDFIDTMNKDKDFKRSVQSSTFVDMLVEQRKGGVQKVRKQSEINRRVHYQRERYKKCLEFYNRTIEDIKNNLKMMNQGQIFFIDIMDYLRLLLQEGCCLQSQDSINIRSYIKEGYLSQELKGCEKEILANITNFIIKVDTSEDQLNINKSN